MHVFRYLSFSDSKSVVDICKTGAIYFTTDTHLIATGPTNLYKRCRCFVHGGPFRITITDLRLNSKSERDCSSVALVIQSNYYDCSTPDYENIFNQPIENSLTTAFVSLTSSFFNNSTAEMVWITLQPEGLPFVYYKQRMKSSVNEL